MPRHHLTFLHKRDRLFKSYFVTSILKVWIYKTIITCQIYYIPWLDDDIVFEHSKNQWLLLPVSSLTRLLYLSSFPEYFSQIQNPVTGLLPKMTLQQPPTSSSHREKHLCKAWNWCSNSLIGNVPKLSPITVSSATCSNPQVSHFNPKIGQKDEIRSYRLM